jgi:hypothetical protein
MTWLYKNNKSNILLIKNKYKLLKKKRFYILRFKNKVIKNKKIFFKNNSVKNEIPQINITVSQEKLNNYITKICIFLGRQKNMSILHKYIELGLKETILNEYHMFDFSRNIQDHYFIKEEYNRLINIYPHRIFLHNSIENYDKLKNKEIKKSLTDWSPFYKTLATKLYDEKSIIIKCDDDILFIDIYGLKSALEDRWKDKESFLIHSNCINNGLCGYYLREKFPMLKTQLSIYPKGGLLGVLFEKPELAYAMHLQFLKDINNNISNLNNYVIDDVNISSRISINFILINGEDVKYLENVSTQDEYELSSKIPEELLRKNKIKGDLITSHLSYQMQDKFILSKNDIINQYNELYNNYCNNRININILMNKTLLKNPNNSISLHYNSKNNTFNVPNWIKDNHIYIKHEYTNNYIYYDYETFELKLSQTNKTLFELYNYKENVHYIMLGIYYLSNNNIRGNFKNEQVLIKNMSNYSEKLIILEKDTISSSSNSSFYVKFSKTNAYLSITKDNNYLTNTNKSIDKWIFEKPEKKDDFISVVREKKYNKFFYKNIKTQEIYSNIYSGWGYENIFW